MQKLNLGSISTGPKSAKPTHPTVEILDPETTALLEQFVRVNPQFKTLKSQQETLSAQLAPRIKSLFWMRFAGVAASSSTMLANVGGRQVKLITKNAYSKKVTDDGVLKAILGDKLVATYFRQSTAIKLDLDLIPSDAAKEEFANAVIELAAKMNVTQAVSASQCIQPIAGFHDARTTVLTAEQNTALDGVMAVTAYPML